MSILRDLEQKYGLHPSIKGLELQDREGLRKVDYQKGDVKQQVSSTVRSCCGITAAPLLVSGGRCLKPLMSRLRYGLEPLMDVIMPE